MPADTVEWMRLLSTVGQAVLMMIGGWTAGRVLGDRIWPKPPHRCVAHLRLRRNVFVNADPDVFITQGDDGTMEIEGYAIMPRDTYAVLAQSIGGQVPEC